MHLYIARILLVFLIFPFILTSTARTVKRAPDLDPDDDSSTHDVQLNPSGEPGKFNHNISVIIPPGDDEQTITFTITVTLARKKPSKPESKTGAVGAIAAVAATGGLLAGLHTGGKVFHHGVTGGGAPEPGVIPKPGAHPGENAPLALATYPALVPPAPALNFFKKLKKKQEKKNSTLPVPLPVPIPIPLPGTSGSEVPLPEKSDQEGISSTTPPPKPKVTTTPPPEQNEKHCNCSDAKNDHHRGGGGSNGKSPGMLGQGASAMQNMVITSASAVGANLVGVGIVGIVMTKKMGSLKKLIKEQKEDSKEKPKDDENGSGGGGIEMGEAENLGDTTGGSDVDLSAIPNVEIPDTTIELEAPDLEEIDEPSEIIIDSLPTLDQNTLETKPIDSWVDPVAVIDPEQPDLEVVKLPDIEIDELPKVDLDDLEIGPIDSTVDIPISLNLDDPELQDTTATDIEAPSIPVIDLSVPEIDPLDTLSDIPEAVIDTDQPDLELVKLPDIALDEPPKVDLEDLDIGLIDSTVDIPPTILSREEPKLEHFTAPHIHVPSIPVVDLSVPEIDPLDTLVDIPVTIVPEEPDLEEIKTPELEIPPLPEANLDDLELGPIDSTVELPIPELGIYDPIVADLDQPDLAVPPVPEPVLDTPTELNVDDVLAENKKLLELIPSSDDVEESKLTLEPDWDPSPRFSIEPIREPEYTIEPSTDQTEPGGNGFDVTIEAVGESPDREDGEFTIEVESDTDDFLSFEPVVRTDEEEG